MKYWSTGEISKKRNVSNRTLRYYDQINLLTPSYKNEYGKRFYSDEDLLKLEKILILKSLHMPLENIQQLLDKLTYKQILVAHFNHLQEQLADLQTSISNTSTLINLVTLDEELSWQRVTELMHISENASSKWMDYFTTEEQQFFQQHLPSISDNTTLTEQYIVMLKKIESFIARNVSPEAKEAQQVAAQIIELSKETFQGDEQLEQKFWEVRKRPAEETGLFPISNEVLTFVEKSIDYYKLKCE